MNLGLQIIRRARLQLLDELRGLHPRAPDLITKLEELERTILALATACPNGHRPGSGIETAQEVPSVHPGKYREVRMGTAIIDYLMDNPGRAVPITELTDQLRRGGVIINSLKRHIEKGQPNKPHPPDTREVRICISNRKRTFLYDKVYDTIRLKAQCKREETKSDDSVGLASTEPTGKRVDAPGHMD